MNTEGPLFAGVSGLQLEAESFDFGYGITIRKDYAHVMAPLMMAFTRPEKGKPHPPPWKSLGGGIYFDVEAEIEVPLSYRPDTGLDRLNTVWWLGSLLRLVASPCISIPFVSDHSIRSIASSSEKAAVVAIEATSGRSQGRYYPIHLSALNWIREQWEPGARLFCADEDFNMSFQAFDSSSVAGNSSLSLITVWGALEQLFAPAKQELRFRVACNISAFLETPGEGRLNLHKEILKLYDARSVVAHSAQRTRGEAASNSHKLLKRVLSKILEDRKVPTRGDFEKSLFGA